MRFTPVHASWLNQTELLNDAFSYHYLKRGSWPSRQALINHIEAAWPEYNQRQEAYWGRHFWARGYFCAIVGQVTEEMIKEYLEHHYFQSVT